MSNDKIILYQRITHRIQIDSGTEEQLEKLELEEQVDPATLIVALKSPVIQQHLRNLISAAITERMNLKFIGEPTEIARVIAQEQFLTGKLEAYTDLLKLGA